MNIQPENNPTNPPTGEPNGPSDTGIEGSAQEPRDSVVNLTGRDVTRSIQYARRTFTSITLTPVDDPSDRLALTGTIGKLSDDTVEIVLNLDSACMAVPVDSGAVLRAEFDIAGQLYGFAARVRLTGTDDLNRLILLARPKKIWVRQRRRFWRTPVQASSKVVLRFVGETDTITGEILNVSVDGLGCRVAREDAFDLDSGDPLHASFTLAGDDEPFTVDCELRAKSPAGSSDHVILRIQFDAQTMAEHDRLRLARLVRPVSPIP